MPIDPDGYGTDLSCVDDLDEMMTEVGGRDAIRQWAARAITSSKGSFLDCPDDCIDVRDYIGEDFDARDLSSLRVEIVRELEKDERVRSVIVDDVTYDVTSQALNIALTVFDNQGPFSFTLAVDATSITILQQG